MGSRSRRVNPKQAEVEEEEDEGTIGGDYIEDDDEFDPDLADLNDPDVRSLAEPGFIGGRPHSHSLFGEDAMATGQASSPKLWGEASQFPTAAQFRVWRMENGVPVGLGAIAVDATEEDLVRAFYSAMPKPGDSRFQFILRPIDVRGKGMNKEVNINISEHHITLSRIREREAREKEEGFGGGGWGRGRGGDVIVQGSGQEGTGYEEIGRMFEHSVELAEEQTQALRAQLERERSELREQERLRTEERVRAAENASSVTERMSERVLETDRQRSAEALQSQKETSQMVMATIQTTFQQQQEQSRMAAERERALEERRQSQERVFFERREKEQESQRQRERDEADRRRAEDRAEHERKLERERLDLEGRKAQMKAEADERRDMDQRRRDQEKQDTERKERLESERFAREKLELQHSQEKMRLEWEQRREEARREDERKAQQLREEMDRREQTRRSEVELQQKQMEMQAQKDREHSERMMEMARQEREAQRENQLARERADREARESTDAERQRRHELQLREMEVQKERDREHAERMIQMSKLESGGNGLGGLGEMLGLDTPDLLARIFGGGDKEDGTSWSDAIPKVLGGLGEMAKVVMTNQAAGAAAAKKGAAAASGGPVRHGRRAAPKDAEQKMVAIQTAEGVKLISEDQLHELQQHQLQQMQEQGVKVPTRSRATPTAMDLPDAPFRPPGMAAGDKDEIIPSSLPTPKPKETSPQVTTTTSELLSEVQVKLEAGRQVDTLRRANDAGIPLIKQRKARQAVRKLGERLHKADESEWMGLVTEALTTNIDIYHYLKAVTVYAALAEARLDADFAGRIVASLRGSNMVPDGLLPFDEDDLTRIEANEIMAEFDKEEAEEAAAAATTGGEA